MYKLGKFTSESLKNFFLPILIDTPLDIMDFKDPMILWL